MFKIIFFSLLKIQINRCILNLMSNKNIKICGLAFHPN